VRALFVLPNLAAGGVERQWSILLPGLRERGIDARLIALDAGGPFETPLERGAVPFEVLNMRHQTDAARLFGSRLIRCFPADVVVSQSVSGLYVGELVSAFRRGVHVHAEHAGVGFPLSRRREAMVRMMARAVDWVIAVSPEQVAPWLARRFPGERIVVIPNGVPESPADAPAAAVRAELSIPQTAVAALLVATLRREKRVPDFIEAVSLARKTNPTVFGLVVGDGPERAVVQDSLKPESGVRLLGHRDDVPNLMKAADIFVLASEQEAVPMSILEAMAAGLPVVATGVGGIPGVVADGESGWLVPPRDPAAMAARLVELAADRNRRLAMGAAGQGLHRAHWDAERMVDRYAEFLQTVGR
jgi:glycosyltransferase involved in cell wall biosynthesis